MPLKIVKGYRKDTVGMRTRNVCRKLELLVTG